MRRRNWILLAACACLVVCACQNKKEGTPEFVTEQFAKAIYTADYTHMYQYTTRKSDFVVKQLQDHQVAKNVEKLRDSKVEIVETKVLHQTDSTASCSCTVKINGRPRTDQWDLLKENDEWKVIMP